MPDRNFDIVTSGLCYFNLATALLNFHVRGSCDADRRRGARWLGKLATRVAGETAFECEAD